MALVDPDPQRGPYQRLITMTDDHDYTVVSHFTHPLSFLVEFSSTFSCECSTNYTTNLFITFIEPYAVVLIVDYGQNIGNNPLECEGSTIRPFWGKPSASVQRDCNSQQSYDV